MKKLIRSDLVYSLQQAILKKQRSANNRSSDALLALTEQDLNVLLKLFTAEIGNALMEGNSIELRNFGVFELRRRKEKKRARNPKTGVVLSVPSHQVIVFRAGKHLRKAVWALNISE